MFELNELMKKAEGILKEDGFVTDDGGRIEEGIRGKARSMMEQDIVRSINFAPLDRLQDRKSPRPWQGKESDAEIAFSFESFTEAQDIYDLVTNTGMLEHGEVRLVSSGDQHSVHFASHVLVMKPDVIQAVMFASEERVYRESTEAFNRVAEDIATVLRERQKCRNSKDENPVSVDVSYNESVEIDIVARLNENAPRARKGSLYTKYWDNLESVAVDLATVIRKLPNRHEITEEDAANVIKAVKYLSLVSGMVVEARAGTEE